MKSRGVNPRYILDMAYDVGLERPHIATAGEWDGGMVHILTYGPPAYRKTMEIAAPTTQDEVDRQLRSAFFGMEAKKLEEPKPSVPVAHISTHISMPKPKAKRGKKDSAQ